MKCNNCGSELKANANFCCKCGTKIEQVVNNNKEIKEEVIENNISNKPKFIVRLSLYMCMTFIIAIIGIITLLNVIK